MIRCPKCGRPIGGRARSCGYCGESLVSEYFRTDSADSWQGRQSAGVGALCATILGVFGCLVLLMALGCQVYALFSDGQSAAVLGFVWWMRTLPLAFLPIIRLIQLFMSGGFRESVWADGIWLFLSACGLLLTIQVYVDAGTAAFYGMVTLAYLFVVGCALVAISAVLSLLVFRSAQSKYTAERLS